MQIYFINFFRRFIVIFSLFFILNNSYSQVLYYENFEDITTVNWQLNTVSPIWFNSGVNQDIYNKWTINSSYLGGTNLTINPPLGLTVPDTDLQPGLINNSPLGGYLHTVMDTLTNSFPIIDNCSYADASMINALNPLLPIPLHENISAEMFSGISTTGITDIEVGFWWICGTAPVGNNGGGYLYFSIDGGNTWLPEAGPLNSSTWVYDSYSNPAWDNIADLRFAFVFNSDMGGVVLNDMGFGIDDFSVSTSSTCFVDFGNDTILCEGESLILDASTVPNASFVWNTGDTTSSIIVDAPGVYAVDIADQTGCQYTESIIVSFTTPVTITSSVVHPSFCGASDGEINISVTGGVAPYYYSVDNGVSYSGSNITAGLSTGVYPIVIFDAASCYSNHEAILLQEPSDVNATFNYNSPLCGAPGSALITGTATNSGTLISADLYYSVTDYMNIGDTIFNSGQSGNTVLLDSIFPGIYVFMVTDLNCTTIDTVTFIETEIFVDSINSISPPAAVHARPVTTPGSVALSANSE